MAVPAIMHYFSDNESAIIARDQRERLAKELIGVTFTTPEAHSQAAIAERANRTILDMSRSLLIQSGLPIEWWQFSHKMAAWIYNRLPSRANPGNLSPYQMWYGSPPDLSRLRTFGCVAWSYVTKRRRPHKSKMDPTAYPTVFVGFADNSVTGYLVRDLRTNKTLHRYSLSFDEGTPGSTLLTTGAASYPPTEEEEEDEPVSEEDALQDDGWSAVYSTKNGQTLRQVARLLGIDARELQEHNVNVPGAVSKDGTIDLDQPLRRGTGLWIPTGSLEGDRDPKGSAPEYTPDKDEKAIRRSKSSEEPRDDHDTEERAFPAERQGGAASPTGSLSLSDSSDEGDQPDPPRRSQRIKTTRQDQARSATVRNAAAPFRNALNEIMLRVEVDIPSATTTGLLTTARTLATALVAEWQSHPETDKAAVDHAVRQARELFHSAYLTEQMLVIEGLEGVHARDIPTPKNFKQSLEGDFSEFWRQAVLTEVKNLEEHGVWEWVNRSSLPPGRYPIDTTWSFKAKANNEGLVEKFKARLCARGFRQRWGLDFVESYSPVTTLTAWRACIRT